MGSKTSPWWQGLVGKRRLKLVLDCARGLVTQPLFLFWRTKKKRCHFLTGPNLWSSINYSTLAECTHAYTN